jgi:hypothetical protein
VDKSSWDQRAPGVQRQTPKLPLHKLEFVGRAYWCWEHRARPVLPVKEKGRIPPFILTEATCITSCCVTLLEMKLIKLP